MASKKPRWQGVVTKSFLPIRKQPSADALEHTFSPISGETVVRVCDTAKGWYYIEADGHYGYASSKYIDFYASVQNAPTMSKTGKWVGKTTQAVRFRSSVASTYKTISTLSKGSLITVCDTKNGYWYAKVGSKYGYVAAKYVTFVAKGSNMSDVFLESVKNVHEYARTHGYIYADSQASVPTADKKISCDRLVAKALYDLGYTDQPKGGLAFRHDFDAWFRKHGFKKSTSMSAVKAGSILVVMNPSGSSRHMFVVASRKGSKYTRYDCGSNDWIRSKQPLAGLWMSRLIAVYNIA